MNKAGCPVGMHGHLPLSQAHFSKDKQEYQILGVGRNQLEFDKAGYQIMVGGFNCNFP